MDILKKMSVTELGKTCLISKNSQTDCVSEMNRRLKNNNTLSAYAFRTYPGSLRINIDFAKDTIGDIKMRIYLEKKIPISKQRIISSENGELTNNNSKFSSYNPGTSKFFTLLITN